jgi:hypothetical protein
LNKKTVDSQDDLTTLRGLKDAAQATALQNSVTDNRNVAANQIILQVGELINLNGFMQKK